MEIGFGAMFLKMVWDIDIYQTMLTVLTITGVYTITGELAPTMHDTGPNTQQSPREGTGGRTLEEATWSSL